MTEPSGFTVDVDQNIYLPAGAADVDAVVTVTAAGGPAPVEPAGGLEMIIVDCSASMGGDRISSARRATAVAIAELRDGVSFTVIAGQGGPSPSTRPRAAPPSPTPPPAPRRPRWSGSCGRAAGRRWAPG